MYQKGNEYARAHCGLTLFLKIVIHVPQIQAIEIDLYGY